MGDVGIESWPVLAAFAEIADAVVANSGRDRTTAFVYSVGWTQHTVGAHPGWRSPAAPSARASGFYAGLASAEDPKYTVVPQRTATGASCTARS
jgi:hypothetical protein